MQARKLDLGWLLTIWFINFSSSFDIWTIWYNFLKQRILYTCVTKSALKPFAFGRLLALCCVYRLALKAWSSFNSYVWREGWKGLWEICEIYSKILWFWFHRTSDSFEKENG